MQIIDKILKVSGNSGSWINSFGDSSSTPEITIGTLCKLRIDLRTDVKESSNLNYNSVDFDSIQCHSYYFALDSDYLSSTDPKLLTNSDITLVQEDGLTILECPLPNTNTTSIVEALAGNEKITLKGEIGGFVVDDDNKTNCEFVIQFSFSIRNRVYLGDDVPEYVENSTNYYTKTEIDALIAKLETPVKGDTGATGASAYEIAVEEGYEGTVTEWLEYIKGQDGTDGQDGENGANAYEIAVENGYSGTVTQWLIDLQGVDGATGATGQGLTFDAVGELSELDAYANEDTGFVFAYNNSEGKTYIYVKLSSSLNDWSGPLAVNTGIDGKDGLDGLNVEFIPPVEFEYTAGKDYFYIDMSDYSAVHVNFVCIDTDDGEVVLPFNSALGVENIIRKTEDGKDLIYIYFGDLVPAYTTGRVYFAQGVTNNEIVTPDSDDDTTTTQYMYYGYVSDLSDISDLDSIDDLTEKELATVEKFSVGSGSAGDILVVLLPADSDYVVTKFDGISGAVAFDTAISGANGDEIEIDNITYKLYGEAILATGERFIYVN